VSLASGTRIGPYEIAAQIGVGGMGEVYRATDTNLGRQVALKVLPDSFAQDPERLARFGREATTLASLNHPNIAAIYGLERTDGTTALVMELVEGPTLADRIAEGLISIDEALPIGKQVAEALGAAHEQGIIHRDLKPSNIKLRPDGTVKVLDFGLAKVMEPARGMSPGLPESPTITTPAMTQAGTILGTAAYMSPEQAEGRSVDKRTDIWSFGVVIYEMLTGRVPFPGNSFAGTVAAVLKTEPDWTRVPPPMRRMLVACLEKDPKRRLRDVGDAWRLFEQPTPAVAPPIRRWAVAAVVILALGAAMTWAIARSPGPAPAPAPVTRWSITLVESGGGERGVALSRDGRWLAYTGRVLPVRPIWVRALDEINARPIPGTEGGRRPFFSPDGKWLAYFSSFGRSSLMKVPLAGGAPTRLCENAAFHGGSWGDDDQIIFSGAGQSLMRVSASGGPCETLTTSDVEDVRTGHHRSPQILPGGKAVLFGIAVPGGTDDSQIAVLDLDSREYRVLDQRGTSARYVSSGHLVYARSSTIFAVPFDIDRLMATGPEVLAVDGVLWGENNGATAYTVSATGTLVYTSAETAHRTLVWINRGDGTAQPSPAPPREYGSVSVSPDGRRVATFLTRGGSGVLIVDLERGTVSRVSQRGTFPVWTPDGARVVWAQGGQVFWTAADGSGTPELLASEPWALVESTSPDGRTLSYTVSDSADMKSRRVIKLFQLPGAPSAGSSVLLSGTSNHSESGGRISPDGKWIAYVSDESGKRQVYLRLHAGPGGKVPISIDGGDEPRWSRTPQELFFRNPATNQLMTVDIPKAPGSEQGRPRALASLGTSLWDVAPDGKRFLVVTNPDSGADPATVQVVMNWFGELRQKTALSR
jgi:Tol biopolymer transport system component